jgi:hypothetical protein
VAERRTGRKGAPGLGAAKRTLAAEHRSARRKQLDGRLWWDERPIPLVGSERCYALPKASAMRSSHMVVR